MARASRRWWWGGLALLMVLSACGRRAKPAAVPVPAMTAPEPAAETASEKHYPKVGFRLTLPASWHETPAPAELARDGKGTAVAFSQGTGELPRVMVTGIDKVAYARWVGTHLEATPVERAKVLGEELKQSLLGGESGGHKLGVVSERVWTARGIKSAWRIRFRGAGAGRPQTGDLIVAEDFRGGVFVIMVEANDDAGLDQADKLLQEARDIDAHVWTTLVPPPEILFNTP